MMVAGLKGVQFRKMALNTTLYSTHTSVDERLKLQTYRARAAYATIGRTHWVSATCGYGRPYLAAVHLSATKADDEARVKSLSVFRTFKHRC